MKDRVERLRDVDFQIRREAVRSLKGNHDNEAITLLIEALGDENPNVSSEAVKTLKSCGNQVIPHMIQALKHASWNVRRNAAQVLAGMGNSFLNMLLDFAKSNDDDIQFWICEVISQFGSRAVKTLVEILETEDMPRKLCALSALGKTDVKEAVKPLITCLSNSNWIIRKTAAGSLVSLGQISIPEVVKLIDCQQTELEFWAIQILGEIDGEKARQCLIHKILDEATPVDQKQALISGLKNFDHSDVVAPLIQMLGDEDWIVRKQAGEALWEIGDVSEELLGRALSSKNHHIRYWAARVLGDLQASQFAPALLNVMKNDETWSVRAAAAAALGETGDDKVTLDLVDALKDSSEYVKKNAMISLHKLGEIQEVRTRCDDEWVQDYTSSVFSDLKSRKTRTLNTRLRSLIKDVPDFPKPGIIFKDIGPLLASPIGISDTVKLFEAYLKGLNIDLILGIEARGFILGAALAQSLKLGFVPVRKKGKLPGDTLDVSYDLEYGSAELEIQKGRLSQKRVVILDDVLATGGTAQATAELVEKDGGIITSLIFLIELDFLKGREKLKGYRIESLIHY
jgi:adenine phosphoribosyltransferase